MSKLITTLGAIDADEAGVILPHEHIFVDLGPIEAESYRLAKAEDVITLMAPEIEKIKGLGVKILVECTPVGVGRRADILKAFSEATDFPLIVPTGIYRQPWVPAWAQAADQRELHDWMLGELSGEIEGSGVQAAWIKLSAGDDGMTEVEEKILRAAAQAGMATGAVIGSHTIRGSIVHRQLDVIEAMGYTPERFIWIHTQAEPDLDLHLEVARRGAWIEYDAIGNPPHGGAYYIDRIRDAFDAGIGHRVLLSHDRGWYDPSQPAGGVPKPFTYINQTFLPRLQEAGFDDAAVRQLTCVNPALAFAR